MQALFVQLDHPPSKNNYWAKFSLLLHTVLMKVAGSYSYVKNLKCSLVFIQEKICLRVRTTGPWCQAKSSVPQRFHQLSVLKVECLNNCNRFHGFHEWQMYYVLYRIYKSTLDQASWKTHLSNISLRMSKNVIKQSLMRLICSPNKQVLLKADL